MKVRKSEPVLFNKTQSAAFFQVSTQAFSAWDVEPVKKSGREVFYDLRELVAYRHDNPDDEDGELNLTEERAKLTKAQRIKTTLERKQLEGRLMDVDFVVLNYIKMAMAIRAKLLSTPTKIAKDLTSIDKPSEVQQILKDHIQEILTEISSEQFSADIGIDVDRTLAKLEAMQATA